ncbi:MAG: trigger factor, partial [Candidatus Adiutrix sp.]
GLELEKLKNTVDDEAMDKRLNELRRKLSTLSVVTEDRPLAKGDMAVVEYQGYEDEKLVTAVKAAPFNVELGDDRLEPIFEEGLTGMRAGETKDLTLTIPDDHPSMDLAGRTLVLRTTVLEIKMRSLPTLDDEMAKDLDIDGVETLEQLKAHIKGELETEAKDRDETSFNTQLTHILASLSKFEVPDAMVDREVASRIETMRNTVWRGADLKKIGIDIGGLRAAFRPEAKMNVKAALVLDQIAKDNNVEISDDDLQAEFEEMSLEYGQPPEILREYYESKDLMSNLREGLKVNKTLEMIKGKAIIKEVEALSPPPSLEGGAPTEEKPESLEAPASLDDETDKG